MKEENGNVGAAQTVWSSELVFSIAIRRTPGDDSSATDSTLTRSEKASSIRDRSAVEDCGVSCLVAPRQPEIPSDPQVESWRKVRRFTGDVRFGVVRIPTIT